MSIRITRLDGAGTGYGGSSGGYLKFSLSTGHYRDGQSGYVAGAIGGKVALEGEIAVPYKEGMENNLLDTKALDPKNTTFGISIGVGGGAGVATGVQEEKTVLNIVKASTKVNINLNNQTGSSPADGTNVLEAEEKDWQNKKLSGGGHEEFLQEILGTD